MATPQWINYKEPTHGVNSEGADDVFNRPNRTIWENFTAEHNKSGTHISTLTGELWLYNCGSYVGDGTDWRQVTTTTNKQIKFLRIWGEAAAYSWCATDSMGQYLSVSAAGYSAADHIEDLDVGSFRVGSSSDVNQIGQTYHYIAFFAP